MIFIDDLITTIRHHQLYIITQSIARKLMGKTFEYESEKSERETMNE